LRSTHLLPAGSIIIIFIVSIVLIVTVADVIIIIIIVIIIVILIIISLSLLFLTSLLCSAVCSMRVFQDDWAMPVNAPVICLGLCKQSRLSGC